MAGTRFLAAALAALTACVAQTPPREHSFAGTCHTPNGPAKSPTRLMLWLHDYEHESATVVADVMAAADGSFRFDRVPWLAGHDWGFRFFVLHAQQGANVAMVYLRGDDAARAPLSIVLQPAVTLRGRVTGPDGSPVAGAVVAVRGVGDAFFAEPPPMLRTTTDAKGDYMVKGLPPLPLRVHCLAARFAASKRDGVPAAGFDFALEPGAVITGHVLLENGRAAVRMRVCAQGHTTSTWSTTTTDDAGRYQLIGLVDDRYNLWVGGDDVTCEAIEGQKVRIGEAVEAPDLVAVAGGFFVGRVVDADTGKPLQPGASADVAIYGPSRPRSGGACDCSPIGVDGTFRIRVPPGSNFIYLRADPAFEAVGADAFTLPVETGRETSVEFRVRRKAR